MNIQAQTIQVGEAGLFERARGLLERIPWSALALVARIAVFVVFWRSGSVKLDDWAGTLTLFAEEYKVPLLPPEIAARLADIPQGNAARGEVMYFGASRPYLGCFQCHGDPNIAPEMGGLSRRVEQERVRQPENAGETVAEYDAESIIHPDRYVVPGYRADLMPPTYALSGGFGLSLPDLQDLVAYLMTL